MVTILQYTLYWNTFLLFVAVIDMNSFMFLKPTFYCPQMKFAKVMFFTGVCLSTKGFQSLSRGYLSRGSLSSGVSVQGVFVHGGFLSRGLCLEGSLSRGSLCRGSLSKASLSNFYHPQMKFAKVMFSQLSVCPQKGLGLCPGGSLSEEVSLSRQVSIQGVSVQGSLCPGGLCPGGVSVQEGSLSGGSLSRGVFIQGVSVQGSLSSRSLCPVGVSVWGVSVQGGPLCRGVSVYGGLYPGVSVWGSLSGRVSVRETPRREDPPVW